MGTAKWSRRAHLLFRASVALACVGALGTHGYAQTSDLKRLTGRVQSWDLKAAVYGEVLKELEAFQATKPALNQEWEHHLRYMLGKCAVLSGHPARGIESLKRADELTPDDLMTKVLLAKAGVYTAQLPVAQPPLQWLAGRQNARNWGNWAKRKLETLAELGHRAPAFSMQASDGQTVSNQTVAGKVVLIDFWATWCGPCVRALPEIRKVYEQWKDTGDFYMLGASLDTSRAKMAAFVRSKKMPWPQTFDGRGWQMRLAQAFNVHSIPTLIVLDGQGCIRYRGHLGTDLQATILVCANELAEKRAPEEAPPPTGEGDGGATAGEAGAEPRAEEPR